MKRTIIEISFISLTWFSSNGGVSIQNTNMPSVTISGASGSPGKEMYGCRDRSFFAAICWQLGQATFSFHSNSFWRWLWWWRCYYSRRLACWNSWRFDYLTIHQEIMNSSYSTDVRTEDCNRLQSFGSSSPCLQHLFALTSPVFSITTNMFHPVLRIQRSFHANQHNVLSCFIHGWSYLCRRTSICRIPLCCITSLTRLAIL